MKPDISEVTDLIDGYTFEPNIESLRWLSALVSYAEARIVQINEHMDEIAQTKGYHDIS
jgi:hypothetical protein